jgi:hypothetical protein
MKGDAAGPALRGAGGGSPAEELEAMARDVKDFKDWPFSGTAAAVRVAPAYFAHVYGRGQWGEEYAQQWLRGHGVEKNPVAEQLRFMLGMADAAVRYDGINILNSASFEIAARRCYGLEKAFAACRREEDWQDPETSKVKLELLEAYDVSAILARGNRVPQVDREAQRRVAERARWEQLSRAAERAGR